MNLEIRDKNGRWSKGNRTTVSHGKSKSTTYICWKNMRRRCETKSSSRWKNYGHRGISVCSRWKKFENFLFDMGEKPNGKTLDRIDVNGNYEPENCRWIDNSEQHYNKTNTRYIEYNGKTEALGKIARDNNIHFNLLYRRLKRGWDVERAIKTPKRLIKTRLKGDFNGTR